MLILNSNYELRPLCTEDKSSFAESLHASFNTWYANHGWPDGYFQAAPHAVELFYDIYETISPGGSVAAFDRESGRLMGSCFYHPREHHVSLGVMSVHPDYFGKGVGKALVQHIVDFTESNGYDSLRLVGSAINMDSFSLYNRAGFVPRVTYHDMIVPVPVEGIAEEPEGLAKVREANGDDVAAMGDLELEVSSIRRDGDYRYCVENPLGCFKSFVSQNGGPGIDGFAIAINSPALNMIGPLVARSAREAAALICRCLDEFRGQTPLAVIPMNERELVEKMYGWGARNIETHLFQVRGEFEPFRGISLPSFLPETG